MPPIELNTTAENRLSELIDYFVETKCEGYYSQSPRLNDVVKSLILGKCFLYLGTYPFNSSIEISLSIHT